MDTGNRINVSSSPRVAGFTLLEILIALFILSVAAYSVGSVFSAYNRRQALDAGADTVRALLSEARSLTVSSKNASSYGVHFDAGQAVLFAGTSYSASDPNNKTEKLHPAVRISAISLLGGGSEVVFDRLSGAAEKSGTVTVSLAADSSASRVITVRPTGIIE